VGAVAEGSIDRGAGGQRLQRRGLLGAAGDLEVAEQAGREGDGARAGHGRRGQGRGLGGEIGYRLRLSPRHCAHKRLLVVTILHVWSWHPLVARTRG
jgi:hypothetical protein